LGLAFWNESSFLISIWFFDNLGIRVTSKLP
jgi:hypothetical protein